MIHELKTDSDVFDAVVSGDKKFEIRKNDRNFQVGDRLWLKETVYTGAEMEEQWTPHMADLAREHASVSPGKPLEYTGRVIGVTVTHILHGPIYGLIDGWCIMSINP